MTDDDLLLPAHCLQDRLANAQLDPVELYTRSLARISHQLSTASADSGASAALRLIRLLDIVSTMPAGPNLRAPCIHTTLRRLATTSGEKCGLERSKLVAPLNAFRDLEEDKGRAAAERSAFRYRRRADLGKLDGLPVGIKDGFSMRGSVVILSAAKDRVPLYSPAIPAQSRPSQDVPDPSLRSEAVKESSVPCVTGAATSRARGAATQRCGSSERSCDNAIGDAPPVTLWAGGGYGPISASLVVTEEPPRLLLVP